MDFTGHGDFTIHTLSPLITQSVFFTLPIQLLQLHSATSLFTLSCRWLITDWFSPYCVILNHRLTSQVAPPAFYTVAYCLLSVTCCLSKQRCGLLSAVVFTGVVTQRCQSCLFPLSNWRVSARLGSAHFGSTRHSMVKHRGRGVFSIARMRHNILSPPHT
jgi:hypothetical protein